MKAIQQTNGQIVELWADVGGEVGWAREWRKSVRSPLSEEFSLPHFARLDLGSHNAPCEPLIKFESRGCVCETLENLLLALHVFNRGAGVPFGLGYSVGEFETLR